MKKTALIIGGSGEIGRAIAHEISDDYQIVNIHKTLRSEIEASIFSNVCADMTDPEQISLVKNKVISEIGNIDLLINCIGKNISVPFEKIDLQTWKDVIDTNLQSVFFLCQIIGTEMLKQKTGVIINFASTAGIKPFPKSPHYIAAKAGVIVLTKYFAQVYAPTVRVNAIAPGYVLTENHKPEHNTNYDDIINKIPLKRMTAIIEIVNAIKFIINSTCVTGQIFVLDGGITL